MKLHRIYNIIVADVVYATSSNYQQILKLFDEVKKTEPKAHIEIFYA